MVRLFVAVKMPQAVQDEIACIQRELQRADLFEGRYVNPAIAHTTLVFLGDVVGDAIDPIKKVLAQVKAQKIKARLTQLDCFRHGDDIKVIYLSFVCEELAALVVQIEDALLPWRTKKEREFICHVTLARVKKVYNVKVFIEVLRLISFNSIAFSIESFTLERSILLSGGPQYETCATYPLL